MRLIHIILTATALWVVLYFLLIGEGKQAMGVFLVSFFLLYALDKMIRLSKKL
jgi:hypothetical protein